MRALSFLVCFFFLGFNLLSAQEQEKLPWKDSRPLTWQDFKAAPKESIPYSANTNSGLSYTWNYSTATGEPVLEHQVFSNFYPELSWVKKIEHKEYLLAHEQLHFDITELHARKLRKRLEAYEIGRTVRQDLKRIYNKVEAERVAMQNLFDKETSHSELSAEQKRWRIFISEELAKLSEYSS